MKMGVELNKISKKFLDTGFLVNPNVVKQLPEDFDFENFISLVNLKFKRKPLLINKDVIGFVLNNSYNELPSLPSDSLNSLSSNPLEINWQGFDEARVIREKGGDRKMYRAFLDILDYASNPHNKKIGKMLESVSKEAPRLRDTDVIIEQDKGVEDFDNSLMVLDIYNEDSKEREVQDFVNYFKARYNSLKNILVSRQSLQNVTSINRIKSRFERGNVGVIGIVNEKRVTKNGNILFGLEDLTGGISVLVNKNKGELFEIAKDILLDEVVGINGMCDPGFGGRSIIFCDEIIFPEIPMDQEFKKLDKEVYAVFTGDVHLGNKFFCAEPFLRFIDWINGMAGSREQREIAKKIKYLFFVGDLVEGVGVYPNQDKDLDIKDVYEQYSVFADLISKIRKDVKVVVIGGNHDAIRIAEPQPFLDKKLAAPLYKLPNVVIANNPATINICSSPTFSGFDILLYHGFSFPYVSENVESIRANGRLKRPDLIMKTLLQKRHLAPPHNSSLYVPDSRDDPLVIKKVPDFFISGHIHRTSVVNYKHISLIGCGCWVEQTEDQRKRGIEPDPSRVILVNLQTREMKLLYFGD